MTSRYTSLTIALIALILQACSSSTTSSTGSGGSTTQVSMFATPSPSTAMALPAGDKLVISDRTDEITITRAYLVIASTTIETSCDSRFSAQLDMFLRSPLEYMIPAAHAHTTPTPTSTGVPYVIDILGADNSPVAIGTMSPSVADYCGVDVDMFAADDDAQNLPADVDMVGRSLYIEASFQNGPSGTGNFIINTGATLFNRYLSLAALMMISADNPAGSITMAINYDTWFDGIDLGRLENETNGTLTTQEEITAVVENIRDSIHHLP